MRAWLPKPIFYVRFYATLAVERFGIACQAVRSLTRFLPVESLFMAQVACDKFSLWY